MSADNWAQCPRCTAIRRVEQSSTEDRLREAYGRVPVEEFDQMREDADAEKCSAVHPSFREDYEFYGAEDGVLSIRYSGGCKVCGLKHTFSADQPIDVVIA